MPSQPALTGRAELVTGTTTGVALALLNTAILALMALVLAKAVTLTVQDLPASSVNGGRAQLPPSGLERESTHSGEVATMELILS